MHPILPIVPFSNKPIEITYLGTGVTGVNIGPARSDRIIVAIGIGENDAAGSMSGATFNAAAGTVIYGPTRSDSFGMAYKNVPTGTTVDVVVTQFGLQVVHLYMITGYKVGFDNFAANTSAGTTLSCAVTTPAADCAIIAGAQSSFPASFSAHTSSGDVKPGSMTFDSTGNTAGGSNPSWAVSHATGNKTGAGATITANCAGFAAGVGCVAVFK